MSIDVGTIRAGVEADLGDIDRGLSGLIASLEKAERQARRVPPPLEGVAEELTEVGQAAKASAADLDTARDSLAEVQKGARGAGDSLQGVEKAGRPMRGTLSGVAQGMSALGSAAGSATGKIGSLGSSLLGAFAAGGGIALGLGAVAAGIGIVSSRIREAAQDARQLDALQDVLGISGEEVDRLRSRFAILGQEVDQRTAVQIMRAGHEAGYSAGEIARMADELKRFADLSGGDVATAAAEVFRQQGEGADDLAKKLVTLAQARRDQAEGIASDEREVIEATRQRQEEITKISTRYSELQAAAREASAELERIRTGEAFRAGEIEAGESASRMRELRASIKDMHEEMADAKGRAETLAQEIETIGESGTEASEALRQLTDAQRRQREEAREAERQRRAAEEAARRAAARQEADMALAARVRQMEAQLAADRVAELEAAAEEEIRIQERAVERGMLSQEAYDDWQRARQAQLQRDIRAIRAEEVAAERERLWAVRELHAQASGDRVALAKLAAAQEIEAEEAKVDGVRYTWEEYYSWRTAREAKLQADIAAIRAADAESAQREAQKQAAEMARELSEEERMQIAGVNAGAAFIGGIRRAFDSDDPAAWLSVLLSGAGAIAALTGAPVLGAVFGGLGGLFHEGGIIGEDPGRKIPRYHDGGMIIAHRGVMLPEPGPGEVPILAQSGEGILSRRGVAAAGGPAAVRAYNNGAAPSGAGGGSTNVYVAAMDPKQTADVLAHRIEPAQRVRGMTRQDEAYIAQARTRINRRTGARR